MWNNMLEHVVNFLLMPGWQHTVPLPYQYQKKLLKTTESDKPNSHELQVSVYCNCSSNHKILLLYGTSCRAQNPISFSFKIHLKSVASPKQGGFRGFLKLVKHQVSLHAPWGVISTNFNFKTSFEWYKRVFCWVVGNLLSQRSANFFNKWAT